MQPVLISAAFDDLRAKDLRFLQEAARLGEVHVHLWSDAAVAARTGRAPKFPYAERLYFTQAARYVRSVTESANPDAPDLAAFAQTAGSKPALWVALEVPGTGGAEAVAAAATGSISPAALAFAKENGIPVALLPPAALAGFPEPAPQPPTGRKKVVVTGCYDWFHTGHVAFFEEVSALGDLHVCIGSDANLLLLKGEGHPLFPAPERLFIAGSIRYVSGAYVASGSGWMDAEPEILNVIRPDIYAVNEDGDKPEKAAFCRRHGIEYVVLQRKPKEGLVRRSSTDLRGF